MQRAHLLSAFFVAGLVAASAACAVSDGDGNDTSDEVTSAATRAPYKTSPFTIVYAYSPNGTTPNEPCTPHPSRPKRCLYVPHGADRVQTCQPKADDPTKWEWRSHSCDRGYVCLDSPQHRAQCYPLQWGDNQRGDQDNPD